MSSNPFVVPILHEI